jgi:hypothetical protein
MARADNTDRGIDLVIERFSKETKNAAGAMLFLQAITNVYDAISAVNSSPLTAERYGADPQQAASAMEYTYQGMALSGFYCIGAALIAGSWWPILGAIPGDIYLYWLYRRAIKRAQERGPMDWSELGG